VFGIGFLVYALYDQMLDLPMHIERVARLLPPVMVLAALAIAAHWLRQNYLAATAETRRAALWVFLGLEVATVLGLGVFVLEAFLDLPLAIRHSALTASPLIVTAGIAAGTFYSGTFDPSRLFRRATVCGLVVLGLAVILGVVEEIVSRYVTELLGLPPTAALWIAVGVSVAALGPLLKRIRTLVQSLSGDQRQPA